MRPHHLTADKRLWCDAPSAGRPSKLDPKNFPAILRLLITGEKQETIANKWKKVESTRHYSNF